MEGMIASALDFERCYRAVESRDARFDGWFITAVKTTGIYCRPSCPTPVRPKRENVRFYPTAAAAQLAGFRACKRCRPDASPGSPEWNVRGDLVGRAMRLIAEGIVDRDGVAGLARRLSVSERHLHRLLLTELGAGPLAIARAQRAQTARTLIETTDLPFTDVAFAAGFESVRQFNDTVREVFALTPTALRTAGRRRGDLGLHLHGLQNEQHVSNLKSLSRLCRDARHNARNRASAHFAFDYLRRGFCGRRRSSRDGCADRRRLHCLEASMAIRKFGFRDLDIYFVVLVIDSDF